MVRKLHLLFFLFLLVFAVLNNLQAQCWAGNVKTGDNARAVYVCPEDSNPDIVYFQHTGLNNANYSYAVTDINDIVLFFIDSYFFDFDDVGFGAYKVWGVSYLGDLEFQPGDNIADIQASGGCLHISVNSIEVFAYNADGGTISTNLGDGPLYVCLNSIPDYISFYQSNDSAAQYAFVITDENDIILSVLNNNYFDFNTLYPGTCRVWGVSYAGTLTAYGGKNITTTNLATSCYEISDNFIAVVKNNVDGGQVYSAAGLFHLQINTGDNSPDNFSFSNNTTAAADYVFILTDEQNNILEFLSGNSYDFDGAPAGTNRIWGASYTGDILLQPGQSVFGNPFSTGCSELSATAVTISIENDMSNVPVEGGMVAAFDTSLLVNVCSGDGIPDLLEFTNNSSSPAAYTYLVTDDQGLLLATTDSSFDFENADAGTCLVYGLSYTGVLTAVPGEDVLVASLASGNHDLSSNYVEVIRTSASAGNISVIDSDETTFVICPDDGTDDVFSFSTNATDSNYVFIITDSAGIVLDILPENSYNFEGAGNAVCYAYGLAFSGNLLVTPGMNIADQLADDCFGLSENYLVFDKGGIQGGEVATADSTLLAITCPGDTLADVVSFITTSSVSEYVYLITDDENNILAVSADPSFDFNDAEPGNCRVWGLAYSGDLLAMAGMNAADAVLASGCAALSDNFINILRVTPEGGSVSLLGTGDTTVAFCVGDGVADIALYNTTSNSQANYVYVITDENNVILSQPGGNGFDFDNSPAGVCRIWGVSYTGDYSGTEGDDITNMVLSTDCYEVSSNFIAVDRISTNAGAITANGMTALSVCVGDGLPDDVVFANNADTSGINYVYLLTDTAAVILAVVTGNTYNFELATSGDCLVYGLAYQGNLLAAEGMNLNSMLADECYGLTEDPVLISRGVATNSVISFGENTGQTTYTCPGDDVADVISFFNNTDGSGDYAYLITDFQNMITAITTDPFYDFESLGQGVSLVWGVSYTGTLTVVVGENATTAELSDGCFSLSNGFLEVVRTSADGGVIETFIGEDFLEICAGDGISDLTPFLVSMTSESFNVFLLTDENNVLQAEPFDLFVDFEYLPVIDVYRVYNVAYSGDLTIAVGDNIDFEDISTGCWDFSENYIEVFVYDAASGEGPCEVAPRSAFEVSQLNEKQTRILLNELVIAPNPAADFIRYNIPLQAKDDITIAVFDVNGLRVKSVVNDFVNSMLDVSGLVPGIYFFTIEINGQRQQRKFIKI